MCVPNAWAAVAEQQNPGFRTGVYSSSSSGSPYKYGVGFDVAYSPSENLNNSAAGIAEKNRRKTLTPDQYGRGLWNKKASTSKKTSTPKEDSAPPVLRDNISTRSSNLGVRRRGSTTKQRVGTGRRTSKAKRFSTRGK
tara:strand:+ start:158 stop:571 length:414 start_codon:yes stop_codon:yes gene_type:complete